MQYISEVSGKGQEIDRVKEQLLQSNPVLEAFGNAKTHRNDNSSRFGKYMDIEFDFRGDPVGGVITNYLLEKSRVAVQMNGERNFHVFYQLLAGADIDTLKALKLSRNHDNYEYLLRSGCSQVDSMNDKENYRITTKGMQIIGFQDEEIFSTFELIATILKLGNLEFIHRGNLDGTDGCEINSKYEMEDVCELVDYPVDLMTAALTQKSVETRGDRVTVALNTADATYARDALCKAIYSRLFSWLVSRINDSIKVKGRVQTKVMGVLDIYGFEVFERNGFEQFIINYCNENLQQLFIELTLKEEQEEYVKEGIEWIHVEYFNNAVICDLIEKNNVGILAMLDEECLRPGKVTDSTFLNKLNQTCCNHLHFESRGCRKNQSDRSLPHDAFRLRHYAGNVTYHVTGFVEKNNDLLFRDLSRAMYSCGHPLLKKLFPEASPEEVRGYTYQQWSPLPMLPDNEGNPEKKNRKRPATAGSQFKLSVAELMKNLQSKNPNYIRCIKPNDGKVAGVFDVHLVKHQVRYLGLMENVRVRRAGYAFRQLYSQFLYRYKMLAPQTWPQWKGEPVDGVKVILSALNISKEEMAFGETKIFIRNPRTLFDLEERRRERMHGLAVDIQKTWKGYRQQKLYKKMKISQIVIASRFRCFWARKCFLKKKKSALIIESYARGMKARKLLAQLREERRIYLAAIVIQKYARGWRVRKNYRKLFRKNAAPKIIRYLRIALRKRFLLRLRDNLPSESPSFKDWPKCSWLYKEASEELRQIFHKWRCRNYRQKFNQSEQWSMQEKVAASDLFKGRKATYRRSVPHPFKGDYLNLQQNLKWKKLCEQTHDKYMVFADIVMKINRANGKMVQQLFVISTQAILIIDHRTMSVKYRIPVSQIRSISLSPFLDKLVFFHLKKQDNGDILSKKGDFIFSSDHVIEIVSKAYLLIKNISEKPPDVIIATQFCAEFKGSNLEVTFKQTPITPELSPGAVRIQRKGSHFEVLVQPRSAQTSISTDTLNGDSKQHAQVAVN
ncbi:unconventional myosin-Ib-like isoform X2 [Liolophura sinensis]